MSSFETAAHLLSCRHPEPAHHTQRAMTGLETSTLNVSALAKSVHVWGRFREKALMIAVNHGKWLKGSCLVEPERSTSATTSQYRRESAPTGRRSRIN